MKQKTHPIDQPDLCITGLGLVTSVGHDHKIACASLRAGLKRPKILPRFFVNTNVRFDDPEDGKAVGYPVLDGDFTDTSGRIAILLHMAARDLMQHSGLDDHFISETPVFIALPEKERLSLADQDMIDLIIKHSPMFCSEQSIRLFAHGHAGMVIALQQAVEAIKKRQFNRVLIAGADSMIGFYDLRRYDRAERLKTTLNPNGLLPGESAGILLVESKDAAENRNADIRGVIKCLSTTEENNYVLSGKTPTGVGLTRAIAAIMDQEQNQSLEVDTVISDVNGETYRFSEWAIIQSRIMSTLQGEKREVFPARFIGDTGAASPAVAACIAVRSMERGYISSDLKKRTGNVLILSSSDTGERGAMLIGGNENENKQG
jgi:3-oxoacyl-[acyl-carrier-protein] synthase-1